MAVHSCCNEKSRYPPSEKTADDPDSQVILCPFLRIVKPDDSGFLSFVGSLANNGLGHVSAAAVTFLVTSMQKGVLAGLRGETPDLSQLDQVRRVSHSDLYQSSPKDVSRLLTEASVEGRVSVQDLVDVKKYIAQKMGVTPSHASKTETYIAFLFAGGNLDTGTVGLEDILAFLAGERPAKTGQVSITRQLRAEQLGKF